MERILVSTGGGDAPGLNAVIYAAVHTATRLGIETFGVRDGYDGLLFPQDYPDGGILKLDVNTVNGIAALGGTILGTTNRGNPFQTTVTDANGNTTTVDRSGDLIAAFHRLGITVLIAIGGDGSLSIAQQLSDKGFRVIGVPKTIDNDVACTDLTFGFQTAVSFGAECVERLRATAAAHRRILCVEVMGRHAGWIALHAGVAAMADAILIPEIPFTVSQLASDLRHTFARQHHAIVTIAEGAAPAGDNMANGYDSRTRSERLGGIGETIARQLQEALGVESRAVTLGHLLRGGSPIAIDRLLGLSFGSAAVEAAAQGRDGVMVALQGTRIVCVPIPTAIAQMKRVPADGMGLRVARALGISFGDTDARGATAL